MKKIVKVLLSFLLILSFSACSNEQPKEEVKEKAVVADGTYSGKAASFGIMKEMELSVTFADNKITSITTVCAGSATQADEDEYSPQYATVENNLFPRIIETQSLAVDSIAAIR